MSRVPALAAAPGTLRLIGLIYNSEPPRPAFRSAARNAWPTVGSLSVG
jgi:hypothetical protein